MRVRLRPLWIGSAAIYAGLAYFLSWDWPAAPIDPEEQSAEYVDPPTFDSRTSVRALPSPSDLPVQLSCAQAKSIAGQARRLLAQPPPKVNPREFALTAMDWLDPHGLWTAAPDSPLTEPFYKYASALLDTLLVNDDTNGCQAARQLGVRLAAWVDALRMAFDQPPDPSTDDPFTLASQPIFENESVQPAAKSLVVDLNRRSARLQSALSPFGANLRQTMRERMFPALSADEWAGAVLASALRAYVILIDAHGAWAPMDEETSLYEVELEATGRRHLWEKMTRTAAGVRIDDGAVAPLMVGDVLLAIDDIATVGLSVEQVEQLGILDPNAREPSRKVWVYRRGKDPERVVVEPPVVAEVSAKPSVGWSRVAYRKGYAAVIALSGVPDDLGMELAKALAEVRLEFEPEGIVLDLRGNGGGSIEGAKEALGPFLPGAILFPMRRRDGSVEFGQAPLPPTTDRFDGPVAVMVDSDTASAAEMIAGALAAYERAVIVGMRTYGKGCAQEYLDDEAGVGVLRLSTLVYALPNGDPVQRAGIVPDMDLDFGIEEEREETIPTAMAPWKGPDVRIASMVRPVPWPLHAGRVGPCQDEFVCKTLRAIGLPKKSARIK